MFPPKLHIDGALIWTRKCKILLIQGHLWDGSGHLHAGPPLRSQVWTSWTKIFRFSNACCLSRPDQEMKISLSGLVCEGAWTVTLKRWVVDFLQWVRCKCVIGKRTGQLRRSRTNDFKGIELMFNGNRKLCFAPYRNCLHRIVRIPNVCHDIASINHIPLQPTNFAVPKDSSPSLSNTHESFCTSYPPCNAQAPTPDPGQLEICPIAAFSPQLYEV